MDLPGTEITAVVAAVTAVSVAAKKAWPWIRKSVQTVNDLAGEPARPGVDARPGLMERMYLLEQTSKRKADSVDELTTAVQRLRADHAEKTTAIGNLAAEVHHLRSDQALVSTDMAMMSGSLAEVRRELAYNGGSTLKDQVRDIHQQMQAIRELIPTQPTTDTRDT